MLINNKSIINIPWLLRRVEKSLSLWTRGLYISINSSIESAFCFWQQYRFYIKLCAFISLIIKTQPQTTDLQQMFRIAYCSEGQDSFHDCLLSTFLSYRLTTLVFLKYFPDCRSNSFISEQRQWEGLIKSVQFLIKTLLSIFFLTAITTRVSFQWSVSEAQYRLSYRK